MHTLMRQVAELQRVVAAKEREAHVLREQMAGIRKDYERRLSAAEEGACRRDSEVGGGAASAQYTGMGAEHWTVWVHV